MLIDLNFIASKSSKDLQGFSPSVFYSNNAYGTDVYQKQPFFLKIDESKFLWTKKKHLKSFNM